MKWSYPLLKVAGIEVRVHGTFLFLLLGIGIVQWHESGNVQAVFAGIAFIAVLFLCVVLHEFGHALTARRYGIRTRDITLLPIGGVARLESMPENPRQEMLVALAGPAVNLVIALLLWPFAVSGAEDMRFIATPGAANESAFNFLNELMRINLMLALFNLLPAFPMDGGRVLRAVLSMFLPGVQATRTAASMGQGLAIVLGMLGLLGNPWLVFIAIFVWIGAASEAGHAEMKSVISRVPITRAMLTDFQTLDDRDALSIAVDYTLAGSQKDFPILRGDKVIGVLTSEGLLHGLREAGAIGVVRQYMTTKIEKASIDESLEEVVNRLQASESKMIAVYDDSQLAGIINVDNLIELIQFSNALSTRH